jgi:hypothetical protein
MPALPASLLKIKHVRQARCLRSRASLLKRELRQRQPGARTSCPLYAFDLIIQPANRCHYPTRAVAVAQAQTQSITIQPMQIQFLPILPVADQL